MALYNEILSGRWNEGLVKLFGLKQGAPAPQLAGEIQPELELSSLPIEYAYLIGERPWSTQGSIAGVGGQRSGITLWNPAGSNTIVVVERGDVASDTAGRIFCGLTTVQQVGTALSNYPRDGRMITGTFTIAQGSPIQGIVSANFTQPGAIPEQHTLPGAFAPLELVGPWVVSPGRGWTAWHDTLGGSIRGTIYWHEHTAVPGEL